MELFNPAGFCVKHGIFPAQGFQFSAGGTVQMIGSSAQCPICRSICDILPGVYQVIGGRLNVLLDPSISPETLSALVDVLEKLQRNEISKETAASEIKSISPKLVGILRGVKQESIATIAAAIISAATAVAIAKMTTPSTTIVNNFYGGTPAISQTFNPPKFLDLPEIGPVPSDKPRPLNRQERRAMMKKSKK